MDDEIYIIDDYCLLLAFLNDRFKQYGYTNVQTFDNPLDALELIKNGCRPKVIVSDYRMPQMDGVTLLCEIERYHPHAKCLIMSTEISQIQSERFPVIEKSIISAFAKELDMVIRNMQATVFV